MGYAVFTAYGTLTKHPLDVLEGIPVSTLSKLAKFEIDRTVHVLKIKGAMIKYKLLAK